jgi:hypothetical protein
MVVHKYKLKDHGWTQLMIPWNAKVLKVGNQCGSLMLWAIVTEDSDTFEIRAFRSIMTGESFQYGDAKYIDTVLFNNGDSVVHVFEEVYGG